MNTYRRFTCVNRSISLFLSQRTHAATELIIYSTDAEHPLRLSDELRALGCIKVVNRDRDGTGAPYTNLGDVRRDSLAYADGRYYICWDDDDIFLPWHVEQAVAGVLRHGCRAWKPHTSLFWPAGGLPRLACNNMEASILVDLDWLRTAGFSPHPGGGEHLGWLERLRQQGQLVVDRESVPSYCFNWHDTGLMRGHKQSGTIDRPDNYEHHRRETNDVATGALTGDPVAATSACAELVKAIRASVGIRQADGYVVRDDVMRRYM